MVCPARCDKNFYCMDTGKSAIDCMKTSSGIKKLAKQKLAAARCLLENEHYDDAYYLAGYSIELFLKAVICKTLGVDDFFEFLTFSLKNRMLRLKPVKREEERFRIPATLAGPALLRKRDDVSNFTLLHQHHLLFIAKITRCNSVKIHSACKI